jgi:hypothetical protein
VVMQLAAAEPVGRGVQGMEVDDVHGRQPSMAQRADGIRRTGATIMDADRPLLD